MKGQYQSHVLGRTLNWVLPSPFCPLIISLLVIFPASASAASLAIAPRNNKENTVLACLPTVILCA